MAFYFSLSFLRGRLGYLGRRFIRRLAAVQFSMLPLANDLFYVFLILLSRILARSIAIVPSFSAATIAFSLHGANKCSFPDTSNSLLPHVTCEASLAYLDSLLRFEQIGKTQGKQQGKDCRQGGSQSKHISFQMAQWEGCKLQCVSKELFFCLS